MPKDRDARKLRTVRHQRVRKKVAGDAQRPRLCVFRSLRFIYAQVIDDAAGHTLVSASSLETGGEGGSRPKPKSADSVAVGKLVAQRAKAQGITRVVFDRGGFKYHGRVKALADAAREAGLEF
ncbi:MAG: 50S ribosomal protein L18 [SAR202 cluster bacterium]|nr:50S ribosomal protein L18 [SAR202 cluster bacterium]